jgi:adenylyltransferase/sulfurtransferase
MASADAREREKALQNKAQTDQPRAAERGAERYSRQVLFHGIGADGQRKLGASHAAIVGCGAIGAATAGLLARAGVGRLTIIDRDFVEESNLQRQVLFDESDAHGALPKAVAAQRKLATINRDVTVDGHVSDLVPANVHALLGSADLVLDGTDNYETRYLINDYCVEQSKPWIYAAVVGAYAIGMNVLPGATACLACMFPDAPSGVVETCETAGVLNSAANQSAAIQTTEALKYLSGAKNAMRRTMLAEDLWSNDRSEIDASAPRTGCIACGQHDFKHLRGESRPAITLCGRNSVQIHEHSRPVDLADLRDRLQRLGEVRANDMLVRFTRPGFTLSVFADGRALIQGTTDVGVARSIYAKYVGN